MRYEVIVVGAGLGGLTCAAALARKGVRVLVLEKDAHPGGTSYVFRRGAYYFPMGPLSFSYPGYVSSLLAFLGIREHLEFKRNHFQLITPEMDLVYSRPPDELREELSGFFPEERPGLKKIFQELKPAMKLVHDLYRWCPDYLPQKLNTLQEKLVKSEYSESRKTRLAKFSKNRALDFLRQHLKNPELINFLGSMGTAEPALSCLTLAMMWQIMSVEGIWYPSWGTHELSDKLAAVIREAGGELYFGLSVKKIVVENGLARGVITEDNSLVGADWVVCNADYKTTFLELVEPEAVGKDFHDKIRTIPYTASELCLYLGLNPARCDFSRMRATHLFYSPGKKQGVRTGTDELNLENGEIEICRWSDNEPRQAPVGRIGLVLKAGLDYKHFARFRTGEKKRVPEYKAHKTALALKLVKLAEEVLPGLSEAIELMEVATPLTYQDWGHRFEGSIAGWSWSSDKTESFGRKLLVETPISNLLMVGIYAASKLFMGGVPTAMRTGELAAHLICSDIMPS
ncbi:MAG: NAD(P)/FAD-dependent oxidoreductase [Candidatus Saccharicenans sp.]|nr:NAD(P)/FAD-dependent oxidoreductase [Candidatus Saccharicenans sp.]